MGKNVIVGTAGHIDHGKSSLIKALTNIDPDRLKTEKEKGITIDLGYAYLKIGEDVISFVDVPGHKNYVKNMIAGATTFDIALIVVDGNEKIKAQTIEHTNIISSLLINQVIVAITKVDMILNRDESFREIKNFFDSYNFRHVDYVFTSIYDKESIEDLKNIIKKHAKLFDSKNENYPFFMPVDRVFSKQGFGAVVTGSCLFGKIKAGDEVEILPLRKTVRVKNISIHYNDAKEVRAHTRAALNLSNIEAKEIKRGDIICEKGAFTAGNVYFCKIEVFKNTPVSFEIKNNKIYHIYIGTAHFDARIVLLNKKKIENGESDFARIVFSEAVSCFAGEHFLLRSGSPVSTFAGGTIITSDFGIDKKLMTEVLNSYEVSVDEGLKTLFQKTNSVIEFQNNAQYFSLNIDNLLKNMNVLSFDTLKISSHQIDKWLFEIKERLITTNEVFLGEVIDVKYFKNKNFENFLKERIDNLLLNKDFQYKNLYIKKMEVSFGEKLSVEVLSLMNQNIAFYSQSLISEKVKRSEKEIEIALNILLNREKIRKIDNNIYISNEQVEAFINAAKYVAKKEGYIDIKNIKKFYDAPRKLLIALLEYLDRRKDFIKKENRRYLR